MGTTDRKAKCITCGLSEKDCRILVLDSMQSTTLEQADNGKNYIDVMKKNFSLVAEANR